MIFSNLKHVVMTWIPMVFQASDTLKSIKTWNDFFYTLLGDMLCNIVSEKVSKRSICTLKL